MEMLHRAEEDVQGSDSSGTDSLHAASAGGHEPTDHPPHPESKNEELGVRSYFRSIPFPLAIDTLLTGLGMDSALSTSQLQHSPSPSPSTSSASDPSTIQTQRATPIHSPY